MDRLAPASPRAGYALKVGRRSSLGRGRCAGRRGRSGLDSRRRAAKGGSRNKRRARCGPGMLLHPAATEPTIPERQTFILGLSSSRLKSRRAAPVKLDPKGAARSCRQGGRPARPYRAETAPLWSHQIAATNMIRRSKGGVERGPGRGTRAARPFAFRRANGPLFGRGGMARTLHNSGRVCWWPPFGPGVSCSLRSGSPSIFRCRAPRLAHGTRRAPARAARPEELGPAYARARKGGGAASLARELCLFFFAVFDGRTTPGIPRNAKLRYHGPGPTTSSVG